MTEVDVYLHEPAEGYRLCFYFADAPVLSEIEKWKRMVSAELGFGILPGGQLAPSFAAKPRKVKMDISTLGQGEFPWGDMSRVWILQAPSNSRLSGAVRS